MPLSPIPVDVFVYFTVFVGGAMTVWSFRHYSDIKKDADFEYAALSAFWGLALVMAWQVLTGISKTKESLDQLLQNPFATCFIMSATGYAAGFFGAQLRKSSAIQLAISRFWKCIFQK